jgi:hypothetical protein
LHYDWSDPNRVVLPTTDSKLWGRASAEENPTEYEILFLSPRPAAVECRRLRRFSRYVPRFAS